MGIACENNFGRDRLPWFSDLKTHLIVSAFHHAMRRGGARFPHGNTSTFDIGVSGWTEGAGGAPGALGGEVVEWLVAVEEEVESAEQRRERDGVVDV